MDWLGELLAKAQYGTVPAWFGGLSLLLAFGLFLRDRRRDDRELIDKVGIWLTAEYDRQFLGLDSGVDRIEEGKFTLHARNANDVPVEVHQVAFNVASTWAVQNRAPGPSGEPGVWAMWPGTRHDRHFAERFLLAPDEQREVIDKQQVIVGHQAPERATQLDMFDGITCTVDWFLAVDNAGRRWEVRPGRGRRARRVRWYSYRRRYYPAGWKHPIVYPAAVRMYRLRDSLRDRWKAWRNRKPS